jgi:hypothetical protein
MNSNQIRRDNKGDAVEASLGIGGRIVPVEFMSLKRLKTGHVPFSWYIAHRKKFPQWIGENACSHVVPNRAPGGGQKPAWVSRSLSCWW